jgi:3-isopropylmalate/(R)-2-methylmalate dehydratase small subunit
VEEGDVLEVDLDVGRITNVTSNKTIEFSPLPQHILKILKDGGLIPHVQKKIGKG